jgi:hypothetical protein
MTTYINTTEEKAREILTECGEIARGPERIYTEDLRRIIEQLQALVNLLADGSESFIFWGYFTPAGEFPQAVFIQGEKFFFRADAGEFQQITDKITLDRIKDISFWDHRREAENR